MPLVSVIVPFRGDLETVGACLRSIRLSDYTGYELILADDGSADAAAVRALASRYAASLVRLERNSGPAAARNAAAHVATGEILVFFDADVTVHPDALARFAAAFRDDSSLDALVGSYDLNPGVKGRVAAFRNLLHAHVHHRSAGEISTFWAGCGAVRREKFAPLRFDEGFRQPSIEDVEFGLRLHAAGAKMRLDPAVQVSHRKEWTLASMIYADVFLRARPWTEVMLRYGLPGNLNFRWQDRLSVALTLLLPVLLLVGVAGEGAWWLAALSALLAIGILQWPVCRFLAKQKGAFFSLSCFPLLLVHYFCAGAGFGLGLLRSLTGTSELAGSRDLRPGEE